MVSNNKHAVPATVAADPENGYPSLYDSDRNRSDSDRMKEEALALKPQPTIQEGEQKFHRLGWMQLTICLIVEAIALGSLSIPSAFAAVGMVAGVVLSVSLGFIAIYTSYVVGQVKLKYPQVNHYSDAVGLIWGKFGYELCSVMFVLLLVLIVGSHALTGTIAWINIIGKTSTCALVLSLVSAVILFVLALPPTFHDFRWLGYIDFVSIIAAIMVTIVATGVVGAREEGGLAAVEWSAWPPPDVTFAKAFIAVTNIVFAYSFAVCQFSFMAELHTPTDYVKSIWALGLIEMFIYTLTGALIYSFVGDKVASPALLSAGSVVSRVAFGIGLPVIFISGSINSTVVARYIMDRVWADSPIRLIQDRAGWTVWIVMIVIITIVAWIVAEAIPFFSDLLGIISSLFVSGFTFYFPALFWFQLIKEGKWYDGWRNISLSVLNAVTLVVGIATLVCGTYASVQDILDQYAAGKVRSPFSCSTEAYT